MNPMIISALASLAGNLLNNKSKEEQARLQGFGSINPLPVDQANPIPMNFGGSITQRILGGFK